MKTIPLLLFIVVVAGCTEVNENTFQEQEKNAVSIPEPSLKNYLDTAGTRINSISQAVLYYQQNYLPTSPVSCDSHLVMLKNFSLRVTDELNMENVLGEYISDDGIISSQTEKKFARLGFIIEYAEGMPYLILDAGYLKQSLEKCLSRPMYTFMEEFEKENKEIALEDAGLNISTSELERRLIFWDKFISENKNFILEDEARVTYNFYLDLYTTGVDNTPAFDPITGELYPDLKNSYSKLISQNNKTKTSEFIRDYYDILNKNNFTMNANVKAYIKGKESPF